MILKRTIPYSQGGTVPNKLRVSCSRRREPGMVRRPVMSCGRTVKRSWRELTKRRGSHMGAFQTSPFPWESWSPSQSTLWLLRLQWCPDHLLHGMLSLRFHQVHQNPWQRATGPQRALLLPAWLSLYRLLVHWMLPNLWNQRDLHSNPSPAVSSPGAKTKLT